MGNTFHPLYGTTSAYAENTSRLDRTPARIWNYLRVRGEYVMKCTGVCFHAELPPRTRRIPSEFDTPVAQNGTTSAYAENTTKS